MTSRLRLLTPFLVVPAALLLGAFAPVAPSGAAPQTPAPSKKAPQRTDSKPQADVAAKNAAFAVVPATAPAFKSALKATDLEGAKKRIGKTGTFTGAVSKVFAPRSNSLVILNFAKDYRTAVAAVVFASSFSAFPPLASLEGKTVLVTGPVKDYQGRPEVILTSPSQVKIVP